MSIDNGRGHATMADVARLAGVSVPTVSRVVTGTINVRAEKRDRVLAAIAELGFRPSAAARTLASGRSETIAVIAGNTARHGYAETIRGVEEAARAAGYTVMITVVDSAEPDEVDRAVSAALNQSIAGARPRPQSTVNALGRRGRLGSRPGAPFTVSDVPVKSDRSHGLSRW